MIRVFVGGDQRLWLSEHATVRYQERVKPALTVALAREDLSRVLAFAEVRERAPAWAVAAWAHQDRAEAWAVLSGVCVFPVVNGRMLTCLTPGPGDGWRSERSERRRERSADRRGRSRVSERRQTRARQSKRGAFARDSRRRARDLKEGADG